MNGAHDIAQYVAEVRIVSSVYAFTEERVDALTDNVLRRTASQNTSRVPGAQDCARGTGWRRRSVSRDERFDLR